MMPVCQLTRMVLDFDGDEVIIYFQSTKMSSRKLISGHTEPGPEEILTHEFYSARVEDRRHTSAHGAWSMEIRRGCRPLESSHTIPPSEGKARNMRPHVRPLWEAPAMSDSELRIKSYEKLNVLTQNRGKTGMIGFSDRILRLVASRITVNKDGTNHSHTPWKESTTPDRYCDCSWPLGS